MARGDIISENKNNHMYKQISYITLPDAIYYKEGCPRRNLYFQAIGNICKPNEVCEHAIPIIIEDFTYFGKRDTEAILTIDEGTEIILKSHFQIGYYRGMYEEPCRENSFGNYLAGIVANGTPENHIKIYMQNTNLEFQQREMSNLNSTSNTYFNYVDFIDNANTTPQSTITHKSKYTVNYSNCTFDRLRTIQFTYTIPSENISPHYFLPQATFNHCTFTNFYLNVFTVGYPDAELQYKDVAKIYVNYSSFENNNNNIIVARRDSRVKLHHCNIYSNNYSIPIVIYNNASIDARWNFWDEINIPTESPQLTVNPWYKEPISFDSFHISEAHIDLLKYSPDPSNFINVSLKPSSYPANWSITSICDTYTKSISNSIDSDYARISLDSSYFQCNNCQQCSLNISMQYNNNISNMESIIQINSSSPINYITLPQQSSSIPDLYSLDGFSPTPWELYFNELPLLKDATKIIDSNSNPNFPINLNLSEFPNGHAYLILSSNNQIERIRHIILGYGRPTLTLSNHQINPTAGNSITASVTSPITGTLTFKICNKIYNNICFTKSYEVTENSITDIQWNGYDDTGVYSPDGIYLATAQITTPPPESLTFVYNPTWKHNMHFIASEVDKITEPNMPTPEIAIFTFVLKIINPSIINFGVIHQQNLIPVFQNMPMHSTGSSFYDIPYSIRYLDPYYPNVCADGYLTAQYYEQGTPENSIIVYGAAPLIKEVNTPFNIIKSSLPHAWNKNAPITFKAYPLTNFLANQGIKVIIRSCDNPSYIVASINKNCEYMNQCIINWSGINESTGSPVSEGCYLAEIRGSDNRLFNPAYESLSHIPYLLFIYLIY